MARGDFLKQLISMADESGVNLFDDAKNNAYLDALEKEGYDLDEVLYSGTMGKPAEKIFGLNDRGHGLGDNWYGGIFSSKDRDIAESHGNKIQHILTKNYIDADEVRSDVLFGEDYEKAVSSLKKQSRENLSDDETADLLDFVFEDKSVYDDEFVTGDDRLSEILGASDKGEQSWAIQGLKGKIASDLGYDGVGMLDEHGESSLALPGALLLEPSLKKFYQSGSIRSLAPISTGLGLASLYSPNQAKADQNPNAYLAESKDVGSIKAPVSKGLSILADYAGKYNDFRSEKIHPLLDLVLPVGQLPEEYLRQRSYNQKPTLKTNIMSALGVL